MPILNYKSVFACLCLCLGLTVAAKEWHSTKFSMPLPEGNYDVTFRLGNADRPTENYIKAESRRFMIDKVVTKPGEFIDCKFTVNIRTPKIAGGGKVWLKKREWGHPRWDKLLMLEVFSTEPFTGKPKVVPNNNALTVFLAGDSTVTDQGGEPWCSWGMMLPAFFQPGVAVANHAESGLTLGSFKHQKRLDKIFSVIKPGDYVFIQFGHNDQKEKGKDAGPFKSYKRRLEQFVDKIRKHKGNPVVVTPMERRRFRHGKPYTTLHDYAKAVRQVAAEKKVPMIDLHTMSLKFYGALGSRGSTKAFVHYPANTFPGQKKKLKDDTHHNVYGGYELAKCIVEGIKENVPELAKHLRKGLPKFDPSKPDKDIDIPASTVSTEKKPDGN